MKSSNALLSPSMWLISWHWWILGARKLHLAWGCPKYRLLICTRVDHVSSDLTMFNLGYCFVYAKCENGLYLGARPLVLPYLYTNVLLSHEVLRLRQKFITNFNGVSVTFRLRGLEPTKVTVPQLFPHLFVEY